MPISLEDGAIIIADSHYSTVNPQLLQFLRHINEEKIQTKQIIFLGDIFDLLIGEIKETHDENREAIALINKIALKIEIHFLEGNHDFNLSNLFENVNIIPIKNQPLVADGNGKKIFLYHGDKNEGIFHLIFTFFIRNVIFLRLLNLFTLNFLNGKYTKQKIESLKEKNICSKIENFEQIIVKKLTKSKILCDIVVEGHYHQKSSFQVGDFKYINIESFACNKSYIIVEYLQTDIEFKSVAL